MKSHQFTSNMGGRNAALLRLIINGVSHDYLPFGDDVTMTVGNSLTAKLPIKIDNDVISNNSYGIHCPGQYAWAEGCDDNFSVATVTADINEDTTIPVSTTIFLAEGAIITINGAQRTIWTVNADDNEIELDSAITCTTGTTIYKPAGAFGKAAHSEGIMTQAIKQGAHAEGALTSANGEMSHAEGLATQALESGAHAEGSYTKATYSSAHAEGQYSEATASVAHAEGSSTLASGYSSHAEGHGTVASDNYAHAEGESTWAGALSAHAEGRQTQATGYSSHAEGDTCVASGINAHAEGDRSVASDYCAHAEGTSVADAYYAHAEGKSFATAQTAHSEGTRCAATGQDSHAEGYQTFTSGQAAHTEGSSTVALSNGAHAEGYGSVNNTGCVVDEAGGNDRYIVKVTAANTLNVGDIICFDYDNLNPAETEFYIIENIDAGASTIDLDTQTDVALGATLYRATAVATKYGAHSEGCNCKANGYGAHSGGDDSLASGYVAFAHGSSARASSDYSIALGYNALALGQQSCAINGGAAVGKQSVSIGNQTSSITTHTVSAAVETDILYLYSVIGISVGNVLVVNGNNYEIISIGLNNVQIDGIVSVDANTNVTIYNTGAVGPGSVTIGEECTITGKRGVALGKGLSTIANYGVLIGTYNNDTNAQFAVGEGTADNARADSFKIDSSGKLWFKDSNGILTNLADLLAAHNIT